MWMVAALSILVTGLTASARSELRVAQFARETAAAAALGDAAIQLAVLTLLSSSDAKQGLQPLEFQIEGVAVSVAMIPAGGLVDINAAGEPMLTALLVHGAQMPATTAALLSEMLVEARDFMPDNYDSNADDSDLAGVWRGGPFEYPEDLLQVQGVSFDEYDRIRRLITVSGGGFGVDPAVAPVEVLEILTGGDRASAQRLVDARVSGDPDIDLSMFDQELVSGSYATVYRIDARLQIGKRWYRRTQWLNMENPSPDGGPWRAMRIESPVGIGAEGDATDEF